MAKEGNAGFEIPADMRALAEKSVEQAKQAFDIFISAAQHAVSTAENHAKAGAKEVGELAVNFAERNIASSFEFAQKLLQAKDPKDVMALHAEYVSTQVAALTEQGRNRPNERQK